ncbi:hypothetical protein [Streptomyces sp. SID12501]|uniref:Uncharacterized protein n=1 Tax=Streptomyces sp. SID12501 TaxID=2706042 RepID=A0A6B3BNJ3_9ACTN|nr:hypothetical protein [Streptomyces sp. SID12501]NEC85223.1 hypothetical protein [Streptomyces sp. SID12501]
MSADPNFQDRMFLESEAIYQRILDAQVADAQAELMAAQLRASQENEQA